ncbi:MULTISPECIES: McrC family protein [Pseudomonas]|uniref:McrC family protein n=1 Tax=Pseudomonas sp. BC115LW TaxID=2683267 RepID=UPI001413671E|nr:restriction endonuclease [Pseudomonas sp. BC115LW]
MSTLITVREYARLTTDAVEPSLDRAQVSASAFDWLCKQSESFSQSGAALVQVEGRHWLRLDSYVGVLETPCGTRLEILPKHFEDGDCEVQSRELLRRMIQRSLNLKPREVGPAVLELYNAPLSEWVMGQFLVAFDHLIKRGMRFDYQRVEEEQRYLRGQLNVVAQMRQPSTRQHFFQVRHDIFVADRAENRLLKLALERVCKTTQEPANWRLAHELRSLLQEVPASSLVREDFRAWRTERLMAHYQPVKPWCELILNQQMPVAVAGEWQGISLLFPMEKLFERYVEAWLRRSLPLEAKLTAQASSEYLCEHNHGRIFRLEPDLLVRQGSQCWVLDTKWKRLNAADRDNKYGLSQSDFYQLFAYGQKYLQGRGELVLIYPRRKVFQQALPPFDFGGGLRLWVLPFDMDAERLLDADLLSLALLQA